MLIPLGKLFYFCENLHALSRPSLINLWRFIFFCLLSSSLLSPHSFLYQHYLNPLICDAPYFFLACFLIGHQNTTAGTVINPAGCGRRPKISVGPQPRTSSDAAAGPVQAYLGSLDKAGIRLVRCPC